jgi:hypothetical protein
VNGWDVIDMTILIGALALGGLPELLFCAISKLLNGLGLFESDASVNILSRLAEER